MDLCARLQLGDCATSDTATWTTNFFTPNHRQEKAILNDQAVTLNGNSATQIVAYRGVDDTMEVVSTDQSRRFRCCVPTVVR